MGKQENCVENTAGNTAQIMNYIKIARPDHWIKNVFILPGLVLAVILIGKPEDMVSFVLKLLAGFFATCFIASANYVINEWLDAEFDQYHPTKKYRPVVSQNMKFSLVMVEYAICIVLGLALSLPVNIPFLLTEVWLLVMGVLYNVKPIRTKDIVYFDVLSESVNNMIRLLLGRCIFNGCKTLCGVPHDRRPEACWFLPQIVCKIYRGNIAVFVILLRAMRYIPNRHIFIKVQNRVSCGNSGAVFLILLLFVHSP